MQRVTKKALGFLLISTLAGGVPLACSSSPQNVDGGDAASGGDSNGMGDTTAMDGPVQDTPAGDVPAADTPGSDVPGMDVPAGDAPAMDVPRTDAPTADTPATDTPATDTPASDAPRTDVGADAARCDPIHETTSPNGVCDGRGMLACTMWAQANGGMNGAAVCLSGATGGCARATNCTNVADPSTCRCGTLPACAVGEVCVTSPDSTPSCRCAMGR